MKIKYVLMMVIALTVSACASTPPEQSTQTPPQQEQMPPPVFERPAPIPEPRQPAPQAQPLADPGPTPGTVADFKYSSGEDRVYFAYNRSDLSPQARGVLKLQAEWLNKYPGTIVVIGGNADERGTREYNLALGARRADSAKAFLVSQGVTPSRITTVSYGKERPIDGHSNEAAWQLNRNAHSAVLTGGNS